MYLWIPLQNSLTLQHGDNRLLEILVLLYQTTQHHIPESTLPVMEIPAPTVVMVAYKRCGIELLWEWWWIWWFNNIGMCTGCFWVITGHFIEKCCCRRSAGNSLKNKVSQNISIYCQYVRWQLVLTWTSSSGHTGTICRYVSGSARLGSQKCLQNKTYGIQTVVYIYIYIVTVVYIVNTVFMPYVPFCEHIWDPKHVHCHLMYLR